MFKKKVWKRGDKLNAKELNRIEEGIANSGSGDSASTDKETIIVPITVNMSAQPPTAETEVDITTITTAVKTGQDVVAECDIGMVSEQSRSLIRIPLKQYFQDIETGVITEVRFDDVVDLGSNSIALIAIQISSRGIHEPTITMLATT